MGEEPIGVARVETKISAMLSVRNGAKAVDFYTRAFGATTLYRFDDDAGSVIAQLAVGSAEFWLADESPQHSNFSPETLGGSTLRMILIADDPDAVFNKAIAAGAMVVWPVEDQRYHWRIGRLVDPFGHHWEIVKPI